MGQAGTMPMIVKALMGKFMQEVDKETLHHVKVL